MNLWLKSINKLVIYKSVTLGHNHVNFEGKAK